MIFPLAGPGGSYCAWDLEDLNRYCGRFYDTTGRTSGNGRGVSSIKKGGTESNLQLCRSTSEPNRPFSLATKILTMKKCLTYFQRDRDKSCYLTVFFLQWEQIIKIKYEDAWNCLTTIFITTNLDLTLQWLRRHWLHTQKTLPSGALFQPLILLPCGYFIHPCH